MKNKQNKRFDIAGYSILFFLLLGCICILSLVPPVSRDALVHHLAIPKLYLSKGIIELPCMRFSYYPMNLDMLYMFALYLNNDILPKFMHSVFGLMTAGLIFYHLKKRLSVYYGCLGALVFLSIPLIIRLSITVYVDLGLVFFSFAALLSCIQWIEKGFQGRYLVLSAVCCGLAMGTKYNGMITFLIMALWIPWTISRQSLPNINKRKLTAWYLLFVLLSLMVVSPWLIRNFNWTGNPVYPEYDNIFQSETQTDCEMPSYKIKQTGEGISQFYYRHNFFGETWMDHLLLPIRYFSSGKDKDPQYFDGKLSIVLIIFPFLILCRSGRKNKISRPELSIWIFYPILFFLIAIFTGPLRVRYIAPILPGLVILSVFGLQNLVYIFKIAKKTSHRWAIIGIISLSAFYTLMNSGSYLISLFREVKPIEYLTGSIDRDSYITRFRPEYSALSFINQNLSDNTKTLFFYIGGRGYYCNKPYVPDKNLNLLILFDVIEEGEGNPQFLSTWLKQRGITHLLMNNSMVKKQILKNLRENDKQNFLRFIYEFTDKKFDKNGFGLYCLK